MLSESVLEELTRRTDLSRPLVETAWPSLSPESRLQVFQELQRQAFGRTPTREAANTPSRIRTYSEHARSISDS